MAPTGLNLVGSFELIGGHLKFVICLIVVSLVFAENDIVTNRHMAMFSCQRNNDNRKHVMHNILLACASF